MLNGLRLAHQDGVITRALLEEAWQSEIGGALPLEVAEFVCVEGGEEESVTRADELLSGLLLPLRLRRGMGLSVDEILTALETASGQTLPSEVKERLREEIERLAEA
jgi:hypothetical protein